MTEQEKDLLQIFMGKIALFNCIASYLQTFAISVTTYYAYKAWVKANVKIEGSVVRMPRFPVNMEEGVTNKQIQEFEKVYCVTIYNKNNYRIIINSFGFCSLGFLRKESCELTPRKYLTKSKNCILPITIEPRDSANLYITIEEYNSLPKDINCHWISTTAGDKIYQKFPVGTKPLPAKEL